MTLRVVEQGISDSYAQNRGQIGCPGMNSDRDFQAKKTAIRKKAPLTRRRFLFEIDIVVADLPVGLQADVGDGGLHPFRDLATIGCRSTEKCVVDCRP